MILKELDKETIRIHRRDGAGPQTWNKLTQMVWLWKHVKWEGVLWLLRSWLGLQTEGDFVEETGKLKLFTKRPRIYDGGTILP